MKQQADFKRSVGTDEGSVQKEAKRFAAKHSQWHSLRGKAADGLTMAWRMMIPRKKNSTCPQYM